MAIVWCVSDSWYRTSVHGKPDIATYVQRCAHHRGIITEGLLALLVTYASSVQLQAHYPESLVTIFYKAVHETAAVHLEV